MRKSDSGKRPFLWLLWLLEGVVVGFGAILPGISGGTLCVAFGMYRPAIETVSHVKSGIKKHGLMLGFFFLGVGAGFVGLSGLAALLMEKEAVLVTCSFIGFIAGTLPELWRDAGTRGRGKLSLAAAIVAFLAMLMILRLFKTSLQITVAPGLAGYLLCGLLWGLSFIVPGLSSSSLLLFFGLYQPMLAGISRFDLAVLIPMGLGMAACVLLLSRAVGFLYKKYYSVVSHSVLGIVAATAVMILPAWSGEAAVALPRLGILVAGGAVSYLFTRLCARLQAQAGER